MWKIVDYRYKLTGKLKNRHDLFQHLAHWPGHCCLSLVFDGRNWFLQRFSVRIFKLDKKPVFIAVINWLNLSIEKQVICNFKLKGGQPQKTFYIHSFYIHKCMLVKASIYAFTNETIFHRTLQVVINLITRGHLSSVYIPSSRSFYSPSPCLMTTRVILVVMVEKMTNLNA